MNRKPSAGAQVGLRQTADSYAEQRSNEVKYVPAEWMATGLVSFFLRPEFTDPRQSIGPS